MTASRIVEPFDELEDCTSRLGLRLEATAIEQFAFEGCEEAVIGPAWLLYSGPITWRMVIAVAMIVTGVCLIVSTKSDAPAKTRYPMTSGYGNRRTALQVATD